MDFNYKNMDGKHSRYNWCGCFTITLLLVVLILQLGFIIACYKIYQNIPMDTVMNLINLANNSIDEVVLDMQNVSMFITQAKQCVAKLGVCG